MSEITPGQPGEVFCAVVVRRHEGTAVIEMVVPEEKHWDDLHTIGYSFGLMVRHAVTVMNGLNRRRAINTCAAQPLNASRQQ